MKTFTLSLALAIFLLTPNAWTASTFDSVVVEQSCTIPTLSPGDNSTHAASTAFVSAAISALPAPATSVKAPVLVSSNGFGDVPLTGVSPLVVDGVTVPSGKRVLLVSQNLGTDNGIYVCFDDGVSYVLSRASDANTSDLLAPGTLVVALQGTYHDFVFQHKTSLPFTLGTTSQVWTTVQDMGVSYGGNFFLRLDGGTTMQAALPMGGNAITNLLDPVNPQDGATKAYVDSAVPTVADATTISKGIVQLAGDLGGTAASPTVASVGGSTAAHINTAEILANAATSLATANALMRRDSGGAVSATFNYGPTTTADWSWTTTPTTHGGALDSIANWIKNVATKLAALVDTKNVYVSETAGNDSNACTQYAPCATIQRGVNVANPLAAYYSQVIVHVDPSFGGLSYNENVTLSQQGVVLQCANVAQNSRSCVVHGTLTVNLTGTAGSSLFIAASNEVYVNGFVVTSGAGTALTFSGTTYQKATLANCYFQAGSGQSVVETNTGISGTTPSEIRSYDTTFENNSASNPTVTLTAGRFWMYGTTPVVQNTNASGPSFAHSPTATTTGNLTSGSACISSPGSLTNIAVGEKISDVTSLVNSANITTGTTVLAIPGTCSAGQIQMSANAVGSETAASLNFGGSSMIADLTQFTGQYQLTDNTATATFNLATVASGSASCISTPSIPNGGYALISDFGCNSSATNSITGSGVVVDGPGNARFGSSGDIVSTVTQVLLGPGLPQGEMLLGAGATSGTNVLLSIKDGHIKLDQTTAPTTTLSGNAGTGGTPACTVAHAVDDVFQVTLKTGTSAWASGTQCTINLNKAQGAAPICTFSSGNATASAKLVSQQINVTSTTSTVLLSFGVADTAQNTYIENIHCFETK